MCKILRILSTRNQYVERTIKRSQTVRRRVKEDLREIEAFFINISEEGLRRQKSEYPVKD